MRSRGFTLIEMMIVCTICPILAAALGAHYLHVRVSGARIEAEIELGREASLATEWIRRDLRGATAVRSEAGNIVIEHGESSSVRYRVEEGRLLREDRALGRRFLAIEVKAVSEQVERVSLRLERFLGTNGAARIERSFIATRFR